MEDQVQDKSFTQQFLTRIEIHKLLDIGQLSIDLDKEGIRHLIITGRNGSGKTTFINKLRDFITEIFKRHGIYLDVLEKIDNDKEGKDSEHLNQVKQRAKKNLIDLFGIFANFLNSLSAINFFLNRRFVFTSFEAKRTSSFIQPSGISNLELPGHAAPSGNLRNLFLQYIVNKKAQQSFARDDNDLKAVEQIETWFKSFEHQLKILFEDPKLELRFERKAFNFTIKLKNKSPFDFNQMSDGYAAVFSIITELILRMESYESTGYDLPGVVLIDEIETHLHVDLQKQILPFLTSFFPNIQFIVTTHSPFVITSLKDAVVCDLEKKIVVNDLSAYSYDAIIESYYNSDKYSAELKSNLKRYEYLLSNLPSLNDAEHTEVFELSKYFDGIPKHLAKELQMKLVQLELDYRK